MCWIIFYITWEITWQTILIFTIILRVNRIFPKNWLPNIFNLEIRNHLSGGEEYQDIQMFPLWRTGSFFITVHRRKRWQSHTSGLLLFSNNRKYQHVINLNAPTCLSNKVLTCSLLSHWLIWHKNYWQDLFMHNDKWISKLKLPIQMLLLVSCILPEQAKLIQLTY